MVVRCSLAIGDRLSAIGDWLSAIGDWLSAIGDWLSAIGDWLSAIGDRLSVVVHSPLHHFSCNIFPDLLLRNVYE
jgi:hypothetical protein